MKVLERKLMKVLSLVLVVVFLLSLAACSTEQANNEETESDVRIEVEVENSSDDSEVDDEKEKEEDEAADSIEVDENLLSVDVTVPASFFDGSSEEEIKSDAEENGYSRIVVNDDGSVTYTMTKKQYKELLDELKVGVDEYIVDLTTGEDKIASFTSISYNDDLTVFDIKVDSSLYSSWDSLGALGFYVLGGFYQAVAGEEADIIVNFIDKDSGELIESGSSANLDDSFTDSGNNNDESKDENNLDLSSVIFEEYVIVDNDELSITVTEFDPAGDWGPTFTFLLENKTDYNLRYSFDDVSVNGIMLDPFFTSSVATGKKAYEEMSWYSDELTRTGINYISNVEGTFSASDDDDWSAEDIFNETILLDVLYGSELGESTFELASNNGFEKISLIDNDKVRVEVIDFDPEGDWGSTLVFVLENKTDLTLMFSADEVSVNGFMLDPFWATTVAPGKMAYDEMSWYDDQLEESKIVATDIEEIEFLLSASDDNDWMADDIFNEQFLVPTK